MTTIPANLQAVKNRIRTASQSSGRDAGAVRLLAVSKTWPADCVRQAYKAGQRVFAESYVQEAVPKIAALDDLDLEWHFIGPVQSNKTRDIAENFPPICCRCKSASRSMSAVRPARVAWRPRTQPPWRAP